MLILPRDALLTWHMSLKQFTLTAGLLIALAAAENKAQAGTGNGSFATSVTSKTFPREPEQKFCSFIQHYVHRTRCMDCDNGEFEPCIAEYLFVKNETCKVRFPLGYTTPGCRAVCVEARVEFKCCKGYWGKECNECPGGSRNPCNGHGRCLVRSGRCICDVGFHGKACELCQNKNKFGPDCSEDCTCEKWECNSGVHADGGCAPENPCNNSISPCGTNSRCLHMTSGIHVCVCDQGYSDMSSDGSGSDTASGGDCVPTDPCQMNNGGCDSTQYCHPLGTAKSQCRCKKGYEPDQRSATCNLRDVCTPEICGHFASCETREPLKYSCVCRGNYTWNGQTCSSNIIEVLGDLSAGDEKFVGTLQYMYNMTSRLYGTLLASQGPFTLFVPTDKAFREVFGDTLQELFTDDIHMKEIIRQHIVLGHLITAMPSKRYNLQGYTASLNNTKENNRKVKRYYVQSHDKRTEESVITAGDIVASNGVIHIINSVIRLKDDLPDNATTAMDVIGHNPQYEMMHSVILMTASSELFSKPHTTVFISDNKAWARLSHGERQYLISDPNGREELRVILKNHVYPGVVDVADLINRKNMESYANIKVKVTIGSSGYIQLGYDGAKLRQADIPFSTGLCHRVDKVLVPSYLEPLMKGRCEFNITRVIKGRCTDCSRRSCSEPGDVLTEHRKLCSVSDFLNHNGVNSSDPQARRSFLLRNFSPKCYAMCYRVIKTSGCCVGFYGLNCLPCPGGARNICSGNGKCDDGENGTGQCTCKANFTGFSCELCEGIYNFGPRCDQRCTCQFGTCDNGTAGTGKCQSGTCQQGYSGENCDQKLTPCDSDDACQLNAKCYRGSDGNSSCYCAPGFEEDGDNCVRIDFCRRNLCHEQATCSQEAPGVIKCICNHGWHGDGFMCMPNLPCYNDSSCHEDAICHNTEPGQFRCVCKPGYRGNGTDCDLADPCILNDESCHQQEEEHILEFIDYPEIHDDEHSWRSHDQVLSHPVIAGVTAAVVVVLMALFSILIYKKWKRLPWQPSNNLECNFKYSHISTDEN